VLSLLAVRLSDSWLSCLHGSLAFFKMSVQDGLFLRETFGDLALNRCPVFYLIDGKGLLLIH
jgi:hypothetical protein